MRIYSRILGTGSYLPARRLSNADLAAELAQQGVETSDDWIVERTGIRARHFAADEQGCSDLATEAARQALVASGLVAADIDLIIVATSTPDMVFPSVATMVQHKLGAAGCPAFDVQAVCSGFIYALTIADSMIQSGTAKRALVIGSEIFSRILDFKTARPVCCLATALARWCSKPRTSPAFWPPICTLTANTKTSCACPVTSTGAAFWVTRC